MLDLGALAQSRPGWVRPVHRALLMPPITAMMLERTPAVMHGFLSTLTHNSLVVDEPRAGQATRVDRTTSSSRLPRREVPAFESFIKSLTEILMARVDIWLTRREKTSVREALRADEYVTAGVTLFAHIDESAPSVARSGIRRARRRGTR